MSVELTEHTKDSIKSRSAIELEYYPIQLERELVEKKDKLTKLITFPYYDVNPTVYLVIHTLSLINLKETML